MAGKIALGFIAAVLLVGSGFAAGYFRQRNAMLPFKVVRVAREGDSEAVTIDGRSAPFTVLVHESRPIKQTLPGELGQLGEEIFLPDPRYSSESTIFP